jgi:diaminopimelate decarboxylase/aspartate kinase
VYDVVGPVCESADFIAKQRKLPQMFADELIAIADVGAYGYTMANHYNLIALPEEKIISE